MSYERRQFVKTILPATAFLFSGCQDAFAGNDTPTGQANGESPTDERLASPDVSELDQQCIESDFSGYTGTTPIPPPSKPSNLSGDSVIDFMTDNERYVQRYMALYEIGAPTPEDEDAPAHGFPNVRFEDEHGEVIDESNSAWITGMSYDLYYEYRNEDGYREMGARTVTYYISDDLTIRAEVEGRVDPGPDPVEEGTIMSC